jgi:hypothetical protein
MVDVRVFQNLELGLEISNDSVVIGPPFQALAFLCHSLIILPHFG